MKYLIQILFISLILTSFCFIQLFSCEDIDTMKRYNNIIKYIKNDKVIKDIIYSYYPEIQCFEFPDTTEFGKIGVDDYIFMTGDTNKSRRYLWNLRKKVDSLNVINKENYSTKKTNYHNKDDCMSNYDFTIYFDSNRIWSIYIVPKEIIPGLFRSIGYTFKFNEKDEIVVVKTLHGQE